MVLRLINSNKENQFSKHKLFINLDMLSANPQISLPQHSEDYKVFTQWSTYKYTK